MYVCMYVCMYVAPLNLREFMALYKFYFDLIWYVKIMSPQRQ